MGSPFPGRWDVREFGWVLLRRPLYTTRTRDIAAIVVGACVPETTGAYASGGSEIRLATYGTLAPGRQNHGQLSDLPGRWLVGYVHGSLVEDGWGAEVGYPALIPTGPGTGVPRSTSLLTRVSLLRRSTS